MLFSLMIPFETWMPPAMNFHPLTRKVPAWFAAIVLAMTLMLASAVTSAQAAEEGSGDDTYSKREIHEVASDFFGDTSEGLAKAIEHVFEDKGAPNGYIMGEEGSGAIGIGLRYGKGRLYKKSFDPLKVYWQGPSVGFDFGANASKVFVLVYNLGERREIFQRFPGVDGSLYFVAGFGVNYQQSGDIILAPIRTGVGLRAGANIGYLHYTKKKSLIPF